MWNIANNFSLRTCVIGFLIVLLICLYGIFHDSIFLKGMPVPTKPIIEDVKNVSHGYLRVQLNFKSNTAICQKDDYLLIYILSTANHIERRNVIRSTWTTKRTGTCVVFILGQVVNQPVETQLKINAEKKEYQDIVQIDHNETYANVVYKEVAALQWSQHFYPTIPYLFKTDDDLIVDTILISSIARLLLTNISPSDSVLAKYRPVLVSNIQSSDRITFFRGGWAMDYQPTLRGGGKFGVSEDVWPHPVLPAYCSGFGWFMSRHVRDRLVNASHTYPLNKTAWIGDVFVSGFLAKAANVKCTGIHIDYDQTASANCSCLMLNNPMLTVCSSTFHTGGGGTELERYIEYRRAWQVIQLRHNSTNTNSVKC